MNSVSIIFKERPSNWGLRGDPGFWDYLENFFSYYHFPIEFSEVKDLITKEHVKLAGEELTENSECYCEQFDNGGMSSGYISGKFWIKNAFPILEDRIKNLQKNKN